MAENWEAKDEVRGIRGWLLLPLVHLGLTLVWLIWMIALSMPSATAWVMLGIALFAAWCLVRFLQERREVPHLMAAFYVLCIALAVKSLIDTPSVLTIGQAVLSAGLLVYFLTSVRVKNTFFRRNA